MRIIGHIDMDAFFASVEERDNSRFKGRPLVVGADPKGGKGRGVVSTANYKAREYGIRSAMPISEAWRLSEVARKKGMPPAIFCEVNGKKYSEVSRRIMKLIAQVIPIVEQTSIDEAYLDLSFLGSYEEAQKIAEQLKVTIKKVERLTTTVGIGPNRLMAKIATEMQKPDGLTIIREEEAEKILEPLSLRVIPGIGPKTQTMFARQGMRLVKDAKNLTQEGLKDLCGKWGEDLYEKLRGRDYSPVGIEMEIKSVGEQETFAIDTMNPAFIAERLQVLSQAVVMRLKREGFENFRRAVLTVRFRDFQTKTRSRTFSEPISSGETLNFEAMRLLMAFLDGRENPQKKTIRLVGIRVEELS
ncbi:MAG: DNA polymerase IV [Candidatus Liptonbacteria bacterium]|nr:DNA polymerase IV [Candidatus Liptonbacteria bacterium]